MRWPRTLLGVLVPCLLAAAPLSAGTPDTEFMAASDTAMAQMMADMNVGPSGDVDRDFVAVMSPHHQGAIDMARAELRYGRNEALRRLAQEIIVGQQQEIVAMRAAVSPACIAPCTHP